MHTSASIRRVDEIRDKGSVELPECPGVYAFWWVGPRKDLMSANRHIALKGPGGCRVDVEYRDWWPKELSFPCLYVGKTTNIKRRFSDHIMPGSLQRLHGTLPQNHKVEPHNTKCQLRFGIEHIFPTNQAPLDVILKNVGFSYRTDFSDNPIAERFFEEDRLIGAWRPWFNIDSER